MQREMRSYNRTSFGLFALAFAATVVMEHFGISVSSVISYVDGMVQKTVDNTSLVLMWFWPAATMVKEVVSDWRKSKHSLEIELAKIAAGKE